MGWKDGCPTCGGHPNEQGSILHRVGCAELLTTTLEDGTVLSIKPHEYAGTFEEGMLTNLVIMETRALMRPEDGDKWDATHDLVERALERVVYRFDRLKVDASISNRIVNATMKELEHGL